MAEVPRNSETTCIQGIEYSVVVALTVRVRACVCLCTYSGKMSVLIAEHVDVCQFVEVSYRLWWPTKRLEAEEWNGGIYILIAVE